MKYVQPAYGILISCMLLFLYCDNTSDSKKEQSDFLLGYNAGYTAGLTASKSPLEISNITFSHLHPCFMMGGPTCESGIWIYGDSNIIITMSGSLDGSTVGTIKVDAISFKASNCAFTFSTSSVNSDQIIVNPNTDFLEDCIKYTGISISNFNDADGLSVNVSDSTFSFSTVCK